MSRCPSWQQVSPSPRHHRGRGVKISQWRWRPGHWGDNQGRMSHYNDCAKIRHNSPHCYREDADLLAHSQTFFSLSLSKIRSGTLAPSAITRGLSQPSDQRGLILPFFGPWKSSFFLLFTADFMCCHLDSVLSVSEFKDDWYENILMLWFYDAVNLYENRKARTDSR